jgi:hypothetical protein
MYFRKCIPEEGTIKTDHVLAGEICHKGVAHIRLRRLLLAASLSFDRVRNQRARNKNNFLPYREVTPGRQAASNRNGITPANKRL